jgi:hypothetical protein
MESVNRSVLSMKRIRVGRIQYRKSELQKSFKFLPWWSFRLAYIPVLIFSPLIAMCTEVTLKKVIVIAFEEMLAEIINDVKVK